MLATKQPRPKKCRVAECGASFVPARLGQAVCSPACAILDAPKNQEKARKSLAQIERRELKVRKEKLKSRSDFMRDAQKAFNEFIRVRDSSQPCISCDSTPSDAGLLTGSRWDAGHYRSVGACPALRFEPMNTNRQCVRCNRDLSGNAVEYRIRLIRRIGAELVEWLEGPHEPKRYTIEDLKTITAEYRAKTRELKRQAA